MLLATLSSYAQPRPGMMWRGSGGWGLGTPYNRMYDPKVVETHFRGGDWHRSHHTEQRDGRGNSHECEDR